MLKFDDYSFIGTSILEYLSLEEKDLRTSQFNDYLKNNKKSASVNVHYIAGDSLSWCKLNFDKIRAGSDIYILGVAVDIDDEMNYQGNLMEAKAAAERSEASKSIFLANMSHEIRTPIHTVTGLTELLTDTELDGEQGEYVSQIGFAAKVLLTLINDILDFSKIEAGKLEFENIEYNLYDTILNSVDLSALEAHKKGVDVAISIDNSMPTYVWGDQVRMRQIIVNLMSNAVKFTDKGEIILSVKTKILDEDNVMLRIAVTDSGIGISADKQSKLFQAFSQADSSTTRQFGGTGLGLSISSNLVKMMGGEMQVESEEGKGATFFFEIPVEVGAFMEDPYKNPPVERLKALVVDDNAKVNKIFSDMLRSWNFEVVEVYTATEAIEELTSKDSEGIPYDLCFIDLLLPTMDGWQLASEIQSNENIKTTKTFLMSLKGKGIEESKMKLLGWFQGYLTKPVSKEELYIALDELYTRTMEVEMNQDDDIEELESFIDEDDEFMEPIKFSDDLNSELEEIEDLELLYEIEDDEEEHIPVILIVEDHLINQKLFRTILEKSGYEVLAASDGNEAVDVVKEHNPDLVFMDCQMPVMNGYDSTGLIRDNGYRMPIVAVTASAIKGEYEKCIAAGMNDVMTKPFKKDDVLESLNKWLPKED